MGHLRLEKVALNKEVPCSAEHRAGVEGLVVPFFALKMMLAHALGQALMQLLLSAFFARKAPIIDMQVDPNRRPGSGLELWGVPL